MDSVKQIAGGDRQKAVWTEQSTRWQHVGQPTRPGTEDQEIMLNLANAALAGVEKPAIVVLGVTPEVVHLGWPSNTRIMAFDQSAEMIQAVWKPHRSIESRVSQSRWQDLPLEQESVDAVAGDGCLTALQGYEEISLVLAEAARVLRSSGRLIMRCFVRPEISETTESVVSAARDGKIGFFGTLKWRLAMALCDTQSSTIPPMLIHEEFNRRFPDREQLARQTGWHRDTIDTIDSYKNMQGVFTFPLLSEIEEICQPHFRISAIKHGSYELSDRCPTIEFSTRR